MSESYYRRIEREAIEELETLLAKEQAPNKHHIGVIDEKTGKPQYFDPWDIFPSIYGSYSSAFDEMAVLTLENLLKGEFEHDSLANEMFREMLCVKGLCDYGTSPRVCFPTSQFKKLLPEYISKWKQYYKLTWGSDLQDTDQDNTSEAL